MSKSKSSEKPRQVPEIQSAHHQKVEYWLRILDALDVLRELVDNAPKGAIARVDLVQEYMDLVTNETLSGRPRRVV